MYFKTLTKFFVIFTLIQTVKVTRIFNIFFQTFNYFHGIKFQLDKQHFNLEFYKFICTPLANVIRKFECNFRKFASNHYVFFEDLMFIRNMAKGFGVRLYLEVNQRGRKDALKFFDLKLDACEAIRMTYKNYILTSLLTELRRTSNVPYKCPFKGVSKTYTLMMNKNHNPHIFTYKIRKNLLKSEPLPQSIRLYL